MDTRLADIQGLVERIDERTVITHDLMKAHIERDDEVHDALNNRINKLYIWAAGGGLSVTAAGTVAWFKGLLEF
jgi:hypothetical protein